jgi:hypothetical protein
LEGKGEGEFFVVTEDGGFEGGGFGVFLEKEGKEFGLGEAGVEVVDLEEDVAFSEAIALGGGVVAILADVFGEEGELISGEVFFVAFLVGEVAEFHAATNPGTHGPGADSAGDVGAESPVFGEVEVDGGGFVGPFDEEVEGGVFEVVEGPGEVGGGNDGSSVGGEDFITGAEAGFGGEGVGLDGGDGGAVVVGEFEADGGGCGGGVAEEEGDGFFFVVEGGFKSVADLMTVDAGLDDFALPVEVGCEAFGVVGDVGNLEGCFVGERERLFVGEGGFVGGVVFVEVEGGLEGGGESVGGFVFGIFLMMPGAESSVGGAVGIEDEGGEGEVVVELEAGEVEGVDVDEAKADELIEEWGEVGFVVEGGIEAGAAEAGDATEDGKDGFAGGFGGGEGFVGVVVNPAVLGGHFFAVRKDGAFAVFDGLTEKGGDEGEKEKGFHGEEFARVQVSGFRLG